LDFGFTSKNHDQNLKPTPIVGKVYGKLFADLRPFDKTKQDCLSNPKSKIQNRQTRLRFGGRHPLCGIGVVSRIEFTRIPA